MRQQKNQADDDSCPLRQAAYQAHNARNVSGDKREIANRSLKHEPAKNGIPFICRSRFEPITAWLTQNGHEKVEGNHCGKQEKEFLLHILQPTSQKLTLLRRIYFANSLLQASSNDQRLTPTAASPL